MSKSRPDNRPADGLRPIKVRRRFTRAAPGSVLISAGSTTLLCTASISEDVPPWMRDDDAEPRGWVTAEYAMLPGSTAPRKKRERGAKPDSRGTEIQRFIGRSLRSIVDLEALGKRTITLDCDVLEADGGTRTLAVNGAMMAMIDALYSLHRQDRSITPSSVIWQPLAAVSVGMVNGKAVLDLNYEEDSAADVDLNVVMTADGRFVEIQGTGEENVFSEKELATMLKLARKGIKRLIRVQERTFGSRWPW